MIPEECIPYLLGSVVVLLLFLFFYLALRLVDND
jgi:hypothetical protein